MSTCGCGCGGHSQAPEGVLQAASRWGAIDHWGEIKVRLGAGRMRYRIAPGLYALGEPERTSPVFVTGNYKLSFDHLRRALAGVKAWILVLDTRGINVWCAAGKGTFGTDEVCRRIETVKLHEVVDHRRLILPQLGAVGVEAHRVAEKSGFTVVYGPVHAADLPAWIRNGGKKDEAMRRVRFGMAERLVLAPVEIANAKGHLLALAGVAFALALLRERNFGGGLTSVFGGYALLLLGVVLASAVLVPALLPWLPTRSFSIKGAVVGLAWGGGLGLLALRTPDNILWRALAGPWAFTGGVLLAGALAAYVGLNFTGASTYTSQSGTVLETRRALPAIGAAAVLGVIFQVIASF